MEKQESKESNTIVIVPKKLRFKEKIAKIKEKTRAYIGKH
jgi:hypothetical protein